MQFKNVRSYVSDAWTFVYSVSLKKSACILLTQYVQHDQKQNAYQFTVFLNGKVIDVEISRWQQEMGLLLTGPWNERNPNWISKYLKIQTINSKYIYNIIYILSLFGYIGFTGPFL